MYSSTVKSVLQLMTGQIFQNTKKQSKYIKTNRKFELYCRNVQAGKSAVSILQDKTTKKEERMFGKYQY